MKLTPEQLQLYFSEGYLLLPGYFSASEMELLRHETDTLSESDVPGLVREAGGTVVRALHGCHLYSPVFERLTRLPRMLAPAMQILGHGAYVYQFKINFKAAFGGDVWKWHQDYVFWKEEDGMKAPDCVNIALFLDEVNEFNGPLLLIPGSHSRGVMHSRPSLPANDSNDWTANVSADLKYTLRQDTVADLVKTSGIVAPKGPAGSVLFFHPNIAHGSAPNISPFDRALLIVTYNSSTNVPVPPGPPRPEFIVGRDSRSLECAAEDCLEMA